MARRMLIDASHPEQTRVAIVNNNRLDDLDLEYAGRRPLKGNIYLAKVMRIEPSLQAAFVEYGGNRHGFLAFSEIHQDYYRIPVGDRPHEAPVMPQVQDAEEGPDDNAEEFAQQIAEHAADAAEAQAEFEGEAQWEEGRPQDSAATPDDEPQQALDGPVDPLSVIPTEAGEASLVTNLVPEGEAPKVADVDSDQSVEAVGGEVADRPERFVRQRRPRYKIQEVLHRRQVMLVQVVKEERGNKGAALTSYLSLAGRYCVLMPNTDRGGGVSRKITNMGERRRMKDILDQLEVPEGMAVILRTAGMEQPVAEIQRDLDYLLRLWNNIREQTLQSNAPAMIYEEADVVKRSLRDLYSSDIQEVLVAGEGGYQQARNFIQSLVPDSIDSVKLYQDKVPLFFRYGVEKQLEALHSPTVQLRSGGYIVINPTEALVSIDVNSGRATRERHIEETALKTNLEAAEEVARQLRLRDLAGLVVIDFIDMEDGRNNAAVERRLKDAMRGDRARLQIGRISHFGLMELSRQRLRPSMLEANFERCPTCGGHGWIRSVESAELSTLRAIEEEALSRGGGELLVHIPQRIAAYILNQKRAALSQIERDYDLTIEFKIDESLQSEACKIERLKSRGGRVRFDGPAVNSDQVLADAAQNFQQSENGEGEDMAMPMGMPIAELTEMSAKRADRGGDYRDNGGRQESRGGGDRNNDRGGRGGRRRRGGGGRGRDRNERGGGDGRDRQFQQGQEGGAPARYQQAEGGGFQPTGDQPMGQDNAPESGDDQTQFMGTPSMARQPRHDFNDADAPLGPDGQPAGGDFRDNGQPRQAQGERDGRSGGDRGGDRDGGRRRRGRRGGRRRGGERGPGGPGEQRGERGGQPYQGQGGQGGGQGGGGQRRNWDQQQPGGYDTQMPQQQATSRPMSIHDIDTTPRDPAPPRHNDADFANDPPQPNTHASQYETINQAPDKPKGGWWRRITGQ